MGSRELEEIRENNARMRDLLERNENILRRLDEERLPRKRLRFCNRTVHVNLLNTNFPVDEIVEQFVELYGAVKQVHRGYNNLWFNIEFITPESQEKCLADKDFLEKQFRVAVTARIIK